MFSLDAALSGHLAATVIEVLLVDAGYQVVPLGVERIIRELRTADAERFRGVAPPRLRCLPDFFVIDPDSNQGSLVEVKFRRYLHSKLVEDMSAVQEHWAPLLLVLAELPASGESAAPSPGERGQRLGGVPGDRDPRATGSVRRAEQ